MTESEPMSARAAGFGLGLFVAAQIWPVSLLIVRSVLRGSLRIGLAMAAAVALVDLTSVSLGLADAARLIDAADGARLALGLLGAAVLVLLGARTIWSGFPARLGLETAGEVATPRRVRDRARRYGLQPARDRALDGRLPGRRSNNRPRSLTTTAALLADVALGTLSWYSAFWTAVAIARRRVGPRLLATDWLNWRRRLQARSRWDHQRARLATHAQILLVS